MQSIKIHKNDNVAVALVDLKSGQTVSVNGQEIILKDDIPAGHKFALNDLKTNEKVIKYSYSIGLAVDDISAGQHVHTHNVKSDVNGILDYTYNPSFSELEPLEPETFLGYRRADGTVGICNEVWIIPTVGCVNNIVKEMECEALRFLTGNIDGIKCFTHPYGCSQLGDDQLNTLKFLSGMIKHPNAAAVLVVGLGCENGNIDELKKVLGDYDEARVKFIVCQEHSDVVEAGVKLLKDLCRYADTFRREPIPASELVIGLKCGGSDGFSGLTANPLLGRVSDKLIAMGGSAILTEVPEMFGAETVLMERCKTQELFNKTVDLINNFKRYFLKYGERVDENPSPGNKQGGITTLADKSLGCVQKGGTAPVCDVLEYGEAVKIHGLSLLSAPGNDLVASCALMASGAHMVLFTTGRGTPFGCPVPTVKISSNSTLFEKKKNWIDFDAGRMLNGETPETLQNELLELILDIASGKVTAKSETLDNRDLSIFKDGVTL